MKHSTNFRRIQIHRLLTAKIALNFPDNILKPAFCIFLLIVAARMWMMTIPK